MTDTDAASAEAPAPSPDRSTSRHAAVSLAPRQRTALEAERDFLLVSIRDLDEQHHSGELTDDRYESLLAGYTRRAAHVVRILDAARAEPQNVVSLEERRRSRLLPVLGIAAAVAACAALALGLWGASVSSDLDDARSALAQERAAAAVLAQPTSEASLTGARGRLVVGDDGRAVLVVSDVPPVPAGKTYQVWVIEDGRPVSGGLFAPEAGTLAIPVDGSVGNGSVVAVTVEDDGGAPAPTGKPVIASAPVSLS